MKHRIFDFLYRISLIWLLLLYAGIIAIFAILYAVLPSEDSIGGACSSQFSDSLYFSVVTITTLGYGDCSPKGVSRLFSALEALVGIFFIGVAVSILWSRILEIREIESARNSAFKIYFSLRLKLINYQFRIAELLSSEKLTCGIARDEIVEKINSKFCISDLRGFEDYSVDFGRSSKIELFRDELDKLIKELQFLLVHMNFKGLGELHAFIASFIFVANNCEGYKLLLDDKYKEYCKTIAYAQMDEFDETGKIPDTNRIKEEDKALLYLASLLDGHSNLIGDIHACFLILPQNLDLATKYLCENYPNTYRKTSEKYGY